MIARIGESERLAAAAAAPAQRKCILRQWCSIIQCIVDSCANIVNGEVNRPDRRFVSSFEFSMEYKLFMHFAVPRRCYCWLFFILFRRAHVKYIDIWKTFIIIIHALRVRAPAHTHQVSFPLYLSFRLESIFDAHGMEFMQILFITHAPTRITLSTEKARTCVRESERERSEYLPTCRGIVLRIDKHRMITTKT